MTAAQGRGRPRPKSNDSDPHTRTPPMDGPLGTRGVTRAPCWRFKYKRRMREDGGPGGRGGFPGRRKQRPIPRDPERGRMKPAHGDYLRARQVVTGGLVPPPLCLGPVGCSNILRGKVILPTPSPPLRGNHGCRQLGKFKGGPNHHTTNMERREAGG